MQCPEALYLGLVQFEVRHEVDLNGWPLLEDMTNKILNIMWIMY